MHLPEWLQQPFCFIREDAIGKPEYFGFFCIYGGGALNCTINCSYYANNITDPDVSKNEEFLNCVDEKCKPTFPENFWNVSKPGWTKVAVDPNEKGVLAERFIQPDQELVYPIHFENIGDIEAQDVFVTDVLDSDLDISSVKIFSFEKGFVPLEPDTTVTIIEKNRTRIEIIHNITFEFPYVEKWTATLDSSTRTVKWELLNINLEPNATEFVLLSVKPLLDIASAVIFDLPVGLRQRKPFSQLVAVPNLTV